VARGHARCPETLNTVPANLQVCKQAEGEEQDEEPTKALGLTIPRLCWRVRIRGLNEERRQATCGGPSDSSLFLGLPARRLLIGKLLRRLIIVIVARDEVDLYDYIRRDQFGDETVRVITDRRGADRRHRIETHLPDRRRVERRRANIEPLLLTQGWAEVIVPEN
jgi:hypothetical protein